MFRRRSIEVLYVFEDGFYSPFRCYALPLTRQGRTFFLRLPNSVHGFFSRRLFGKGARTTITVLTRHFKRIAFWLWSRTAISIYRRFPVFGRLRGSNAVIESDGRFLVLRRNDGLGLCFPGGLAGKAESNLNALRRELMEETGLALVAAQERFSFESDLVLPATTTVFTATAEGTPRASWEGIPLWLTLDEMDQEKIFGPHLEIVNYLKSKRL